MIHRQRISKTMIIDGSQWLVTVTREFVQSAAVKRQMSNDEFFRFIADEESAIRLLARRKVVLMGLTSGKVMLDKTDLP